MNRAELVDAVAKLTEQPKSEVTRTLTALIHAVTGALSKGDKVTLVGFGTFERRKRQARETNNPQKPGEKISVPEKNVPAFSAGKEFKEKVSQ